MANAITFSFVFYPPQGRKIMLLCMIMMTTTIYHTLADLVLSDHIMKLTIEAAKLSILAYDEAEPDTTIMHNYSGTKLFCGSCF
jgi:hypothetical protein